MKINDLLLILGFMTVFILMAVENDRLREELTKTRYECMNSLADGVDK